MLGSWVVVVRAAGRRGGRRWSGWDLVKMTGRGDAYGGVGGAWADDGWRLNEWDSDEGDD